MGPYIKIPLAFFREEGSKIEEKVMTGRYSMAIRVVEFSNGGYKIRKIFA